MTNSGGFEHNAQSLRIVTELEHRYHSFRGLNLTWEVREGIIKHNSEHDNPTQRESYEMDRSPSLEAQIVDLADEIAYNNHDIDDGLSSQMINTAQLKDIELWQENFEEASRAFHGATDKIIRHQTVIRIINSQVTDLVNNIRKTLEGHNIDSIDAVRDFGKNLARFSDKMEAKNARMKRFLKENLYHHYRLLRTADKAERIIGAIFDIYANKPELLPPHYLTDRENTEGKRLICDYMAGMTDRFALDEYKRLFDPYEKI
ncbi:MAG: deoxyguanosinetriphosphate triphosphohydrolase, partial [Deltaproteobacteria bacterium]|nr:deoxyguanosinetriphosphate triphosphohydrolase [Deltaproteobacteria bacterium]